MGVLLVNSKYSFFDIVKTTLREMGLEIASIDEPKDADEAYLASMLNVIRNQSIDFVFSIGFYPYISLACGAINLPYFSWIIDSNAESYDYSIQNPWNVVYIADLNLFIDLQKKGITNINYLPLAPTIKVDINQCNDTANNIKDLLVWADVNNESKTVSDTMENLLDATKGYLDGMIEQRKCDLYSWSLYEECADYIKRDVEKNYPLENDSFESAAHKYDFNFLIRLLDNEYAFPFIKFLLAPWKNFGHVYLACDMEKEQWGENEKVTKVDRNAIRDGGYHKLLEYRFVIFFPDIDNGNKIPIDLWNAMAAGAFVVIPQWIDTDVTGLGVIKRFKNSNELNDIITYFTNNQEERKKYIEKVKETVRQQGTISDRIKQMFANFY